LIHDEHIDIRYVNTKDNIADLYTKPVSPQVAETLIRKLSGHDLSWVTLPNTTEEVITKEEIPFRKKNKILPNQPNRVRFQNIKDDVGNKR
jgi:hypothetical protein